MNILALQGQKRNRLIVYNAFALAYWAFSTVQFETILRFDKYKPLEFVNFC